MRLSGELEAEVWHDLEAIEGERKMKYVTSVERLAIKRGMGLGIEKGFEKGIEREMARGRAVLLSQQLDLWAERIVDADSHDEVFARN